MSNKDELNEICDVHCQAKLAGVFFSSDVIKMYVVEENLHALLIRAIDVGEWTVLVPDIPGENEPGTTG
jgi:chromatin remodeling complex protein RSC6